MRFTSQHCHWGRLAMRGKQQPFFDLESYSYILVQRAVMIQEQMHV